MLFCLVLLAALHSATAHMEMSWPYPIRSNLDPNVNYTMKDYSYTNPLNADGSNFPCKGYENDRPIIPVITYEAGETYNMTLYGMATHGGGSCQLSLSYDNGATFRVIKSMIGGCPLTDTYDFTIPHYAPDGTALFAWSWYNLIGNREIYMNCAEVNIRGSSATRKLVKKREKDLFTSFDQLPFIWKANVPDVNSCQTVEGVTPVFPEPGPDVQYSQGFSSSSPPTVGQCNDAEPFGDAYEDLGDTGPGIFATSGPESGPVAPISLTSRVFSISSASVASVASMPPMSFSSTHSQSISQVVDKSSTKIIHPLPHTPTAKLTSTNSHQAVPSRAGRPTYATGPLAAYLPCVPGTFLCTSRITFAQCVSASSTATEYIQMGNVGLGMMCLPHFSAGRPTGSASKQYRDDQIVRARPYGSCKVGGQIKCIDDGKKFLVCDQGGWVNMGSVAPGTTCSAPDI